MRTLTSTQRPEWSEQIASLPLSFFFLFFVFLPKPQVALCVRCGQMRAQNASSTQGSTFCGLNDVFLNFAVKPPKSEILGREYEFEA